MFAVVTFLSFTFTLALVVSSDIDSSHSSLEPGRGIVQSPSEDPCGSSGFEIAFDGTAENGYCWHGPGVAPPYYGAFAEAYAYDSGPCGIELILTTTSGIHATLDAYVWQDAGGVPGAVWSVTPDLDPNPVAFWPSVSVHDFELNRGTGATCGGFWIGYWADFSQTECAFYVAADTDGHGGYPCTNIAPGIGYPTGWNNVSVVWGQTQSLGIGAWFGWQVPIGACCYSDGTCLVTAIGNCDGSFQGFCTDCDPNPCEPVPVNRSSWGRIKAILRGQPGAGLP